MSRINTNVSSLIAQTTLARSNSQLQESLTRLSTGLRINVGKDDPAGLIASENLRSDIVSVERAISNNERANQIIATADSALGQVSSLLNDIRALATEAANTGALSDEQIAANQLQVDSSLEAINRVAQVTSFQGRRLLDGGLDFITAETVAGSTATVSELRIDQATFGANGTVAVDIDISAGATQAQLTNAIPAASAAVASEAVIHFAENGTDIDILTVTASTAGAAANGVGVEIIEDAAIASGAVVAGFNSTTNRIEVRVSATATDTTALTDIATAITNDVAGFTAVASTAGAPDGNYVTGTDTPGIRGTLGDGANGGAVGADAVNGLADDLVLQISGLSGSEVFTFEQNATADQIANAVNLVSDAIGVTATNNAGTLEFDSTAYGSSAFVDLDVISEGASGTFGAGLGTTTRDTGDDIQATVNGVTASGVGNTLSINTATLDLTVTVDNGSSTDVDFNITGGGALFQLGPDVVSNQQARIGISSVNTARLGGSSGRLFELGAGQAKALATDPNGAAQIVEEAINDITQLRGRLGALQKTTIDTNIAALNDTLSNLVDAESAIRDADFAEESARLTRAQILVQSSTSVLAIANSNPQNVLALLR